MMYDTDDENIFRQGKDYWSENCTHKSLTKRLWKVNRLTDHFGTGEARNLDAEQIRKEHNWEIYNTESIPELEKLQPEHDYDLLFHLIDKISK